MLSLTITNKVIESQDCKSIVCVLCGMRFFGLGKQAHGVLDDMPAPSQGYTSESFTIEIESNQICEG